MPDSAYSKGLGDSQRAPSESQDESVRGVMSADTWATLDELWGVEQLPEVDQGLAVCSVPRVMLH